MTQRVSRTLLSAAAEIDASEVDDGLAEAGRRLRMRKVPGAINNEEEKENRMLKELGLYEKGMSREQKQELLSVVAASEKSATMEEKSRLIGDKLDCDADINSEFLSFDKIPEDPPSSKMFTDTEYAERSTQLSPCLFNDSNHSSPKVVTESPDMLDTLFQSPKWRSEQESKIDEMNEGIPLADCSSNDSVKRKYDRKQIDPLDFIDDAQSGNLVDKRKFSIKDNSYWSCCCPEGTRPKDFAKSWSKNLEAYHTDLNLFQRRSWKHLNWGAPVVVGRHCSGTLDVWSTKQCTRQQLKSDIDGKEQSEIIDSNSEDDFENLVKKDDIKKRKFNFKNRGQAHGQNLREKSDSKNSVYTFVDSDEDSALEKDSRISRFQDRMKELSCGLESSDQNESDALGNQPAKRKLKPLQPSQSKNHKADGLDEKSFYGSKTSQTLDMHHVTRDEPRPRVVAPKLSKNLQDVLKPNVKVNVNKVGVGKSWLATEKENGSDDEVEIVDALSKRAASKGGDGEVRPKGRALMKLAGLARSTKLVGDVASLKMGESSSKRPRLENVSDSEEEESDQLETAVVPDTRRQPRSATNPKQKVSDEQREEDDVPCPLCGKKFSQSEIEEHASDCQGVQEEASWLSKRTPKNKHRCYICQGVFDPSSYSRHVQVCVANKRITETEIPEEGVLAEDEVSEMDRQQKENYHYSLLSRLDTPKNGPVSLVKRINCVSGESPFENARSLRSASVPFHQIDEGDFSMAHVSTPTFQMFKPISQLKDSQVDFQNQFPVTRQGKKRRTAKSVRTKKRRRSSRGKKSPRVRKAK